MDYTYRLGILEEGADLPEWQNDEEFDSWLTRCGFYNFGDLIGDGESTHMEIYSSCHERQERWLIEISPNSSRSSLILIPDFPSYLMFMKDYAPIFGAFATSETITELMRLMKKLFQAWHGHDSFDICPECDPSGWEQRQERHRLAREARHKKESQ